jgi:hypothetical protein
MTVSLDVARKLAMRLPEVTEEPHFDLMSWRVRGKIFATVPPEANRLRVMLDEAEASEAVATLADGAELLRWGQRVSGVTLHLDALDGDDVAEVLEQAWRRRAPKTLVRQLDAR